MPHAHLLYKLRRLGVAGETLKWLKNWLLNRKQRVKLNEFYSIWFDVTSSIVQGSVLRPLLISIYVADLCDGLNSSPYQFVDNLKLIRGIRDGRDCQLLQSDLEKIQIPSGDLGVFYSRNIKFYTHVNFLVLRANRRLAEFRRIFKSRHMNVALRYYQFFIRPLIEYGISVWWGIGGVNRSKVEAIQGRVYRMIIYLEYLE
eukprot:GHVN01105916.1.p1 GENE.GHVN01105916.1~~GHVN01105916.1.p1  ORF type:complete len:201 (+),score=7.53 GHVN01105916.1:1779-2381(+)